MRRQRRATPSAWRPKYRRSTSASHDTSSLSARSSSSRRRWRRRTPSCAGCWRSRRHTRPTCRPSSPRPTRRVRASSMKRWSSRIRSRTRRTRRQTWRRSGCRCWHCTRSVKTPASRSPQSCRRAVLPAPRTPTATSSRPTGTTLTRGTGWPGRATTMPTGIGCRARAPLIARAAGLQTPQACVAHMIVWACGVRSRAARRASITAMASGSHSRAITMRASGSRARGGGGRV
mmetsp:Transcript_53978/g.148903  ORF Transcript_53978/g.148903 Transcript_53978/m.148903 type:complete len:232 (-) Transcript_53978:3-698(-)